MSDEQVFHIISEGIAGTGMPAFHSLSETERHAIVIYLRSLQGRSQAGALPGNPESGKAVFFGKGECSNCHMVMGRGGFLGSELTAYANAKSAKEVRDAITDAVPDRHPRVARVVATTIDGRKFTGIVRNEDNFSVQLQTMEGGFQSFKRSDLLSLDRDPRPLMPSDYSERLSGRELDDLVSYLMSVARSRKVSPAVHDDD